MQRLFYRMISTTVMNGDTVTSGRIVPATMIVSGSQPRQRRGPAQAGPLLACRQKKVKHVFLLPWQNFNPLSDVPAFRFKLHYEGALQIVTHYSCPQESGFVPTVNKIVDRLPAGSSREWIAIQ